MGEEDEILYLTEIFAAEKNVVDACVCVYV